MDLTGIISVSGNPGLYKVISKTKSGLIVESLSDKKRIPVYSSHKISSLEDISVFTLSENIPLREVLEKFYAKNEGKAGLKPTEKPEKLRSFIDEVVKDCDHSKIYNSDLKKLFLWYDLLLKADLLKPEKKDKKKDESAEDAKKEKTTTSKSKATTKKAPATKKITQTKTTARKGTATTKKGGAKRGG